MLKAAVCDCTSFHSNQSAGEAHQYKFNSLSGNGKWEFPQVERCDEMEILNPHKISCRCLDYPTDFGSVLGELKNW